MSAGMSGCLARSLATAADVPARPGVRACIRRTGRGVSGAVSPPCPPASYRDGNGDNS